jgi:hypothetical protein
MNKIWRRHYLNTVIDLSNNPECDFVDLISKIVKNVKKK